MVNGVCKKDILKVEATAGSWVTNSTANYVFEYCCVSCVEKHRQEKSTWKIYIVACCVWKKRQDKRYKPNSGLWKLTDEKEPTPS